MRVDGGRLFPRLLPGNETKKDFFAAAKIIFLDDLIRRLGICAGELLSAVINFFTTTWN
jgi:hypothetical protein